MASDVDDGHVGILGGNASCILGVDSDDHLQTILILKILNLYTTDLFALPACCAGGKDRVASWQHTFLASKNAAVDYEPYFGHNKLHLLHRDDKSHDVSKNHDALSKVAACD